MKFFYLLILISFLVSCSTASRRNEQTTKNSDKIYLEHEVAKLNQKISALETKINAIEAQYAHQPKLEESKKPSEYRPQVKPLPKVVKGSSLSAEKEFKSALKLYQRNRFADASLRFYEIKKNFPQHLLASHALFWAGDSSARNNQPQLAIRHWEELTATYPRSAYIADAIAGLVTQFNAVNKPDEANKYKQLLYNKFPDAPATLNLLTTEDGRQLGGKIE